MRTIGVVTVSRSDYGIYFPILKRIRDSEDMELRLIVGGTHLSEQFGRSEDLIVRDGFAIADRVDTSPGSDSPDAVAAAIGRAVDGFATSLLRVRPDILVVLGDRFEMFAAAVAALPLTMPVAHIHGGELTLGAIDDALRHCITKLSHVHFVAHEDYARRLRQLGEEPWRVLVAGAPALDDIASDVPRRQELAERWNLELRDPILLVTYHPVTLEHQQAEQLVAALLDTLESIDGTIIFTGTNTDTRYRSIRRAIADFVGRRPNAFFVENFGRRDYIGTMAIAAAMVGNSSSGMIEAPSFALPVVNVGSRQHGRIRAQNVIDAGDDRQQISDALARALDPAFRSRLRYEPNPFGDGHASERIVDHLRVLTIDRKLLVKGFVDWAEPS